MVESVAGMFSVEMLYNGLVRTWEPLPQWAGGGQEVGTVAQHSRPGDVWATHRHGSDRLVQPTLHCHTVCPALLSVVVDTNLPVQADTTCHV